MRRARLFPMIVVGLASLIGQIAMLDSCRAWDYVPAAIIEDSGDSQPLAAQQAASISQPVANSPVAAQASPGRMVDPSVAPAGFYDTRPRPRSFNTVNPTANPTAKANTSSAGAQYRGQKVKIPSMPFGRQTRTMQQPASHGPQSNASAKDAGGYATQRRGGSQPPIGRQMPHSSPMPAGNPAMAERHAYGAPLGHGSPLMGSRTSAGTGTNRSTVPGQPAPNSAIVAPWTQAPPAVAPSPRPPISAPAQQAATAPSPADRLIADAHQASTTAQTEEDYTHIIETCRRAQASQPGDTASQYAKTLISWSLNRRGQLKAEAANDQEAILDFDDAVRADATCWRAFHNRGVLLAQAGQFEKAFDDFSQTIRLNPQFAKAYSNRAALFMVAGNLPAAHDDYKKAIQFDPDLAVAHRGCGRVCQLLGKFDDAIAHYDAAVQLTPNDGYAAACRADLLTDVGRYAEAINEYERAIEIDPSSSQAQGGSAWLMATCPDSAVRNPELAIERAKSVIDQGGESDAVNYDTLAAAEASAGNFESAMESLRKAIELAPPDEQNAYKERLLMYQQAKPYRIAPIDRETLQASYEEPVTDHQEAAE